MNMIISVLIVSYNSKKTILETLESVLNQTYDIKKIELVISDDASTDGSINTIINWVKEHRQKFHSIKILCNKKNLGVSANCNLGWKNCCGDWIKTIAADDILMPDCIELNVSYIIQNPDIKILFSRMRVFGEQIDKNDNWKDVDNIYFLDSASQHEKLILSNPIAAPTSFINNKTLTELNYADEEFKMLEDYPLWIKFTGGGYKLNFMNHETVYYRITDSLSNSDKKIGNLEYIKSLYKFQKNIIWPQLPYSHLFKILDDYFLYKQKKNRNNLFR